MRATQVTVAVSNPADPKRQWEALFLVDTGAIDCMAPANQLRAIGIEPRGKRTYELADGSEIVMEIGVTALESVGIEVDPQNQRLKRLPAVRLK